MATSGSKSITVTSWDTLKFSWELKSQSIENNTSTVSWKMELIATSDGRISSTASKKWSVTVNGTTYSGTNTVGISNNATKTLASGTTTISHASDGTKTFSYSFSQQFSITFSGTSIGTKSGSGSGTLTTIPRKSTLTASNGTLGTAQTLTVSRKSNSFTHTITYKCGSASGTVATKSSSTSISFTPPLTLAQQNKTGTSVSVVFTITTYNGSTSLGSNTKTISCAIPASVKPTVSISVSDPTGYFTTFGSYIQGKSKMQITLSAAGAQGSTIKSYSTTANGKTYTTASIETSVIASSGTLTIKATVTDSRGRTATASTTVSALAYSAPKISAFNIKRCNADGSSNATGAYLSVTFSASVTSLNSKNTATYSLQYKKATVSDYATVDLSAYKNQLSVSNVTYIFAAETASTYDVVFSVADAFSTTKRTTSGTSAQKLFSILARGLGIAFGKVAETENLFDVAFPARFRKGITIDSEWTDLEMDAAFNVYNGTAANQPKFKVVGNVVEIKGVVSPVSAFTSTNDAVVFAKGIPAAYRPDSTRLFVCQGSGLNRWLLTLSTSGTLGVSRYGTTANAEVPTTAWLVFNVTYTI